ncbi:uncharacterized protein BX664DRAFT_383902 [Halteromyces radiatus]|uniref:uncharacterized protein n=1 Tax=Halteromyces radiatus TaxID=101107 RepID=UPI00221F4D28|nr:uncharacterized protein BX664DRAFT_383902 [Halteromyces radiatus]KAI8097650.1 hypothetical protein BX664DRAFT_383902 [Halteromyces radiatus]
MKRPNKKIIAVELDQILVRTLDTFLAWHNDTYNTDMTMTDVYYNCTRDMTRVFGGTKEEGCAKLREFYDSTAFHDMVPLKDNDDDSSGSDDNTQQQQQQQWGALEVLQALKKRKWVLVIVTYRPQFTQATTQRFIDRYYPGLFDGIYYCNQGLSVADQLDYVPKPIAIMCQEIGADYLIDDTLEHCLDCSMLDMTLLLYDHHGKYTYNHIVPNKRPRYGRPTLTSTSKQLYQRSANCTSTLPKNVIRVKSWKDILDQFPMPTSPLRFCHYPISSTTNQRSRLKTTTTSTTTQVTSWSTGKRHYDQLYLPDDMNNDDNNDYHSDGNDDNIDDDDDDDQDDEEQEDEDDDDDYRSTWSDRDAIAV